MRQSATGGKIAVTDRAKLYSGRWYVTAMAFWILSLFCSWSRTGTSQILVTGAESYAKAVEYLVTDFRHFINNPGSYWTVPYVAAAWYLITNVCIVGSLALLYVKSPRYLWFVAVLCGLTPVIVTFGINMVDTTMLMSEAHISWSLSAACATAGSISCIRKLRQAGDVTVNA